MSADQVFLLWYIPLCLVAAGFVVFAFYKFCQALDREVRDYKPKRFGPYGLSRPDSWSKYGQEDSSDRTLSERLKDIRQWTVLYCQDCGARQSYRIGDDVPLCVHCEGTNLFDLNVEPEGITPFVLKEIPLPNAPNRQIVLKPEQGE